MAKNNNKPNKSFDFFQIVILVALVISFFFIGQLWTKVNKIEDGNSGTAATTEETSVEKELSEIAVSLGIKEKKFLECLEEDGAKNRVAEEAKMGKDSGVSGTPGNFLVDTEDNFAVFVPGAFPYDTLDTMIGVMAGGNQTAVEAAISNAEEGDPLASLTVVDLSEIEGINEEDFVRGDKNSAIYLIEYSDYDCSFCRRFHTVSKQLVNEGKIAWVYRQFPIPQIHPDAETKSAAGICAGMLGGNDAFWDFSDALLAE